jgi:hypothetical protein
MRARVAPEGGEVSLTFGGDGELENLIAGLQFALAVLAESKDTGTRDDDLPAIAHRTME